MGPLRLDASAPGFERDFSAFLGRRRDTDENVDRIAADIKAVASDPIIAMNKIQRSRPHVIVLDLELPRMDGFSFLRMLMKEDPIPVVVCSAMASGHVDGALRALEDGAVRVVSDGITVRASATCAHGERFEFPQLLW